MYMDLLLPAKAMHPWGVRQLLLWGVLLSTLESLEQWYSTYLARWEPDECHGAGSPAQDQAVGLI